MSKYLDVSLESLRFTGKELGYLVGALWVAFNFYTRFEAMERNLAASTLENRIAVVEMELGYMEDRQRSEKEQRIYETKKEFVSILREKLEGLE